MAKPKAAEHDVSSLAIDEHILDQQWRDQPEMVYWAGVQVAEAKLELERAKSALEVERAEWDQSIRANPAEFDLEKITEQSITNAIAVQKEYKEAVSRVITARHTLDLATAWLNACNSRGEALAAHVRLHGQQYFAVPRITGEVDRLGAKKAIRKARSSRRGG